VINRQVVCWKEFRSQEPGARSQNPDYLISKGFLMNSDSWILAPCELTAGRPQNWIVFQIITQPGMLRLYFYTFFILAPRVCLISATKTFSPDTERAKNWTRKIFSS
jgi:hypothetical protein